jgi:hypothetical protein
MALEFEDGMPEYNPRTDDALKSIDSLNNEKAYHLTLLDKHTDKHM